MSTQATRGIVLLPRAEARGGTGRRTTRPGLADLKGKRVAFIDDSRPNADVVLAAYQALLEQKYGIRATVVHKVDLGLRINEALPKEVFDKIVSEVDAGLVALGS
ncbi:MAG: hypothetical protein IT531_04340 [Burkholderiales bacterium]|nr:hypothetical protein [Burkholderiales bacterium]